ncbi:MAG: AI-2E family transporter [Anaerolineales bacterium]
MNLSRPTGNSVSEESNLEQTQRRFALPPALNWWWWVWAVAAALIVAVAVIAALWQFERPIYLMILGTAIAAALSTVVNWIERLMPRMLAIVLVYILLIALIGLLGWVIIPPLASQAQQAVTQIPQFLNQSQRWFNRFDSLTGGSLSGSVISQLSNFGSTIVSLPVAIFSSLADIVVVFFISLYGLVATPSLKNFIASLFPGERGEIVISKLGKMVDSMGGYVRGTVLDGVIMGFISYIGLLIIGVPFPLVLGLFAGVMELVPFLGPLISGAAMIGVALTQSVTTALIVFVFTVALHQFEGNILMPNIMRSQTDVSPLLVVIALVAGNTLGGLLGALSAIPLVAALKVFVTDVVAPAVRRRSQAKVLQESQEESRLIDTQVRET